LIRCRRLSLFDAAAIRRFFFTLIVLFAASYAFADAPHFSPYLRAVDYLFRCYFFSRLMPSIALFMMTISPDAAVFAAALRAAA